MRPQHTPAPWIVGDTNHGKQRVLIDAMDGDPTLGYSRWRGFIEVNGAKDDPVAGSKVMRANAALIVTAPYLLEFVAEFMDTYEAGSSARTDDLIQHIAAQQERMKALYLRSRALHAKATGEF